MRISTCSGTCRSGAVYSYVVPGTSDGSAAVSASGSAAAMVIAVAACSALSPTVTVTLPSLDVTLPAPRAEGRIAGDGELSLPPPQATSVHGERREPTGAANARQVAAARREGTGEK